VIRIPSPDEYRDMPFREQQRLVNALRDLLKAWAETERP
jgi:hypothetical protein